jgi:hypothetical protein
MARWCWLCAAWARACVFNVNGSCNSVVSRTSSSVEYNFSAQRNVASALIHLAEVCKCIMARHSNTIDNDLSRN